LRPRARPRTAAQRGAVAIIFAFSLLVVLGFIGLAIDASRMYNRKAELHGVAKMAALAAARALNGTAGGIQAAIDAAEETVEEARYSYNNEDIPWSDSALQFSVTRPPAAAWTDSGAAIASPERVAYVKVDLSGLSSEMSTLQTFFIHVLGDVEEMSISDVAMAGRTTIAVTPLAICAMSLDAAAPRTNPGPPVRTELVEFGFRRGVSYDLMRLNSAATTPQTYLVDPFTGPGRTGTEANLALNYVKPFVCAGTMWMPYLSGGSIWVRSGFPLDELYRQLNTRFGQYDSSGCDPRGAPPDMNVKPYVYNGTIPWMAAQPAGQAAASLASVNKLHTVADPDPAPASNTAGAYGPLWIYAKAAQWSDYKPGQQEPASGYKTFVPSDWASLYKPGAPAPNSYPNLGSQRDRPYLLSSANYHEDPPSAGRDFALRSRRVLNIPLLSCPTNSGSFGQATVVGIGRFFMTVPATTTTIYAEFAGATTIAPAAQVELL
jgi:Flp pilus assembly protein TadG